MIYHVKATQLWPNETATEYENMLQAPMCNMTNKLLKSPVCHTEIPQVLKNTMHSSSKTVANSLFILDNLNP